MEKILIPLLLLILFPFFAGAQARVGITGSFSLANQRINATNKAVYAGENVNGYTAGFTGDVQLSRHWYLQPQLLYSSKGAVHLSSIGEAEQKINVRYVEVPLSVLYKAELPFGKLFAGAGATGGYGIGGTEKRSGQNSPLYADANILNRFDFRLRWTGGLEFGNGLIASVYSEKSLANVSNREGVVVKNRSYNFSIGYLF